MSSNFRRHFSRAAALFGLAATLGAAGAAHADVVVVLNSRDASVTLLDQATQKELGILQVGKEPHHLLATPDNKSLIVASSVANELLFLDPVTGQVQRRMKDIIDPYQIGFSPDQKWFVANALRLDHVDIYQYDGKDFKLHKRIPLGKLPSHMAFTKDSSTVFVTQQGNDKVSAIDLATQQIKWTMNVGKLPAGIAMSEDGNFLLVGIMGSDLVEVIDWRAQKIVKRIKTGEGAHNIRTANNKKLMYVSNRVSSTISIIDQTTMTNIGDIKVPGGPDCMEITADGKTMWATLRFARKVAVIDLENRKVVSMIPVGRSPHGVYFHQRAPF